MSPEEGAPFHFCARQGCKKSAGIKLLVDNLMRTRQSLKQIVSSKLLKMKNDQNDENDC
jgi:hypothetical protein